MSGEEGVEPNIFVVSADDPRFEDFHSLDVVPEQNLRQVKNFFVAFKRLEGDEETEVHGWRGVE